jgi:chromosome segregation ATPase
MQNGKRPERYCRGVKLEDVVRNTTNQQNASTSLTMSNEATPGMDASPEVI